MALQLEDLRRCFEGIIPATLATCSADGIPNITYLSQVHYLDRRHVVLSRQFFNKTTRNVLENPHAHLRLRDPLTFECYALRLRFARSEAEGPLFDSMAVRIQAIASHTGMSGVFRLIAADVFEVLSVDAVVGELAQNPDGVPTEELWTPPPDIPFEQRSEIWALQRVSGRVNRTRSLDELFTVVLRTLNEDLGFTHVRLLVPDASKRMLTVRASHGFGESALGQQIPVGVGLIGTVAEERRPLRLSLAAGELRYGRAVRVGLQREGALALAPEIPLPGLPDAQSHLVLPLVNQDRLTGVLAVESPNPLAFEAWHEAFLEVLGNQVATALERLLQDEEGHAPPPTPAPDAPYVGVEACPNRVHQFCLYQNDDCVFLDGDYLIRNVPARILWKLLTQYRDSGRRDFTNRELRLDPGLGLPEVKDNLESRLILLRKRLEQRCPGVRLVSRARGRFSIEVDGRIELVERASA